MAKRMLESVEYRPIKGAHSISTTRYKTKRGGQGGGPDFDHEREEKVHATAGHAKKHMDTVFSVESGAEDAGEGKEDRSGPESKEPKSQSVTD